jgi:RNA polymerase sigma-70 factor (ECF subfamily)
MLALAEHPTVAWYARHVADEPTTRGDRPPERVRFEEELLELADDAWRVARRLSRDPAEAEDLVQEAYVRAIRSWRSYEPGTNLRAWLLRIVHNLAIDNARRRQRSPEPEPLEEGDYFLYNRLGDDANGGTAEIDQLIERLSQGPVLEALAELPQNFREVVVLVDLGDFSYQEAADALDIPIGTVMSRLHRGRRALKTALAERAVAR